MKFTGIHHLAMATNDMDATIRFWRDLLGMRLVVGYGRPGYRQYFFEISDHDMIAFFEWPQVRKIAEKDHGVPVAGPFAFDHVAFEMEQMEDLFQLKDKLETAGFWVSEAVDHGFIRSIYSFDPNNIPIEFSVPRKDVNVRKNPVMKDKKPSQAALEGSEAHEEYWPPVRQAAPRNDRQIYPGENMIGKELE